MVTPDGPRGPRHSIGDGAIALAHKAQAPVLIVNYIPRSYWQLQSWDRFVIPKPFSSIDFYLKTVSLEGMTLEEAKRFLQHKMLAHTVP